MKERRALQGGAHIVVGTPGRLRDHLERGALDLSACASSCSTRPTRCSTWASARSSRGILDATPDRRRTLLFSATMPRPIVALASRYQKDALRIEPSASARPCRHRLPGGRRLAAEIEHAVVNLLRLHEAETAILFCATREAVRRLHASLTERGFHAVRCRASTARASATTRCRRCATAARGSAWRPTSPRGASTCRRYRWSSTSSFRATPRRCSTARAAPAARAQGHRRADRSVPPPPQGRDHAAQRPHRRRMDRPARAEQIRAKDRERLLECFRPGRADEEDRPLAEQLMAELPPGHRRRAGPLPARRSAGARGHARAGGGTSARAGRPTRRLRRLDLVP